MATSGSINLSATGLDIIKEALELIGVIGENQTPSTDQQASALRTLNYLMKAWQGEGINLFAIQKLTLFLEKNKNAYTVGTDHITASYVKQTVNGAAASGAGTILVDDATGISSGDNIGIELDDGTMQWTTVNGAPAANVITIDAVLTDNVNDEAAVFTYTTKANRPMKIAHAVCTSFDEVDTDLDILPLDQYASLSNKTSDGSVVSLYYDPQVSSPVIYVYPESASVRDRLTLRVQRTLEDVDNATTDDVDYPQEWFLALSTNLALQLSAKYGVPDREVRVLAQQAAYYKDVAEGYDRDPYIEIIPGDMH